MQAASAVSRRRMVAQQRVTTMPELKAQRKCPPIEVIGTLHIGNGPFREWVGDRLARAGGRARAQLGGGRSLYRPRPLGCATPSAPSPGTWSSSPKRRAPRAPPHCAEEHSGARRNLQREAEHRGTQQSTAPLREAQLAAEHRGAARRSGRGAQRTACSAVERRAARSSAQCGAQRNGAQRSARHATRALRGAPLRTLRANALCCCAALCAMRPHAEMCAARRATRCVALHCAFRCAPRCGARPRCVAQRAARRSGTLRCAPDPLRRAAPRCSAALCALQAAPRAVGRSGARRLSHELAAVPGRAPAMFLAEASPSHGGVRPSAKPSAALPPASRKNNPAHPKPRSTAQSRWTLPPPHMTIPTFELPNSEAPAPGTLRCIARSHRTPTRWCSFRCLKLPERVGTSSDGPQWSVRSLVQPPLIVFLKSTRRPGRRDGRALPSNQRKLCATCSAEMDIARHVIGALSARAAERYKAISTHTQCMCHFRSRWTLHGM